MKLYADDAKLYRNIKSRQDVVSLQNDLNPFTADVAKLPVQFESTVRRLFGLSPATHD